MQLQEETTRQSLDSNVQLSDGNWESLYACFVDGES